MVFIGRVIVVAQKPVHRNHLHIINTILPQHFFRHFLTGQTGGQADFTISSKFALQDARNQHTDPKKNKETNKIDGVIISNRF